jgi:tetratricopeptide (TPR) repeat protein
MSDEKRLKDLIDYYDSISETNNYEEIIKVLNEIISILEGLHGPDNVETAKYLNALGNVYSDLGDYQKAETCIKEALR